MFADNLSIRPLPLSATSGSQIFGCIDDKAPVRPPDLAKTWKYSSILYRRANCFQLPYKFLYPAVLHNQSREAMRARNCSSCVRVRRRPGCSPRGLISRRILAVSFNESRSNSLPAFAITVLRSPSAF